MKQPGASRWLATAVVPLALSLCAFKPAPLQAQVQAGMQQAQVQQDGAKASLPPLHLSGTIQIGSYEPLEFKNKARLWLTRFTSPAMLMSADVAYAYGRTAFCQLSDRPAMEDFYTARFAIALRAGARYDVNEALQIKKVDFCKSTSSQGADFEVIAKERIGQDMPRLLINWSIKGSIDGISEEKIIPKSSPNVPNADPVNEFVVGAANQKVLDREYLQRFSETLTAGGVRLTTSKTDHPPATGNVSMMASGISRNARALSPSMPSYCLKDLNTEKKECSDTFNNIAEKIIENMKPTKAADNAQSVKPAGATVPVRFELDILN